MMPCLCGGTCARAFAIDGENTRAMRMATVFMRFMSTPWKAFGHCCVLGYARIGAFPRKSCRFIWDSLSSRIMSGGAGGHCWARFWTLCYYQWHVLKTQYEPDKLPTYRFIIGLLTFKALTT